MQDTTVVTSGTTNSEGGLTLGLGGKSMNIAVDGVNTASRLFGAPGTPGEATSKGQPAFGVVSPTGDLFPEKPDQATPAGGAEQEGAQSPTAPGMDPRLSVALGTHLLRDAYDFGKSLSDPQNWTVTATVGGSTSTTENSTTTSTSVGNVTSVKEAFYLNRGEPGQPATDIVLNGSVINNVDSDGKVIKADGVYFDTNGKVKLGAGQNTSSSETTSSNSSFGVGVGVGLADADVKLVANGSASSSSSLVTTTTNTNTTIDTKNLGVKADVLDLTGANVNTVDAKIDVNKLIVKSVQDTGSIKNSSDQISAGVSVGTHTLDVNGGASTTQGQGNYQAVGTQTSLTITGNYDIKTRTTEVTGGVINAVPGQGNLTTDPGGLIITDLNDTSTYTTNTVGGNFAVGTSGVSGSPTLGGKTLDDSGTTKGGVTATVNGVDQTSSAVSSPPLKLASFLNKPDLAGQLSEAGAIFGKDAFTTAGDIGDALKLETGSTGRVLLHMGAGAATAAVGGGNVVSGVRWQ